jgi:hypothetical protein
MWVTTMFTVSLTDASTQLGHYRGIRILKKVIANRIYAIFCLAILS